MEPTPEKIMADLQLKYQPLVGQEFEGIYNGVFNMPEMGNPRDIISIQKGHPFAVILQGVSQAVIQAYGEQIWKGMTGPAEGNPFTDYWLWVEPSLSQVLAAGSSCKFIIQQCTPFPGTAGLQFAYGVSIKVSPVVQPPPPPFTGTFQ